MVKYNCEICKYETNRKSNFDNHNRSEKHITAIKYGFGIYPCEFCNQKFDNPKARWAHEKRIHKCPTIHTIKCGICKDKTFPDNKSWIEHVRENSKHNKLLNTIPEFIEVQKYITSIAGINDDRETRKKVKNDNIIKRRAYAMEVGTFMACKKARPIIEQKEVVIKVKPDADKLEKLKVLLKEKQDYFVAPAYKLLDIQIKRKMKQEAVRISKQIEELTPKS
jgi:hypothetical protein